MSTRTERDHLDELLEARSDPAKRQIPTRSLDRIAYATVHDPTDLRTWSGLVYFIGKALEQQGIEVEHVAQLQRDRLLWNKAVNKLYRITGAQGPLPVERSLRMARRFAREIAAHIDNDTSDVVFSPSSIPLAFLRSDKPKVFYTDCTFGDLLEQYPELADYPKDLIDEGHFLEREALRNCDLAIYSSHWAARSAIDRYGADPAKVKVVPFGSNLEIKLTADHVLHCIAQRPADRCELLFIGVHWERKGGPLAWETARLLNERGLPTRLTVVGCEPPKEFTSTFTRVIPFIDKNTPWGQRRLVQYLMRSHLLLVPSMAECFGIVYAEASALGVPSLARDVGGVSEAVRTERNGFLFDPEQGASAYADRIETLMNDRTAYEALARASYQEYLDRLNWKAAGTALRGHLEALL